MKTQIITLAAHDDLISVRDSLSWAKSPRILLIWPSLEQVALRPLDLRILQQHAAQLGAQLGVVTRRSEVRRDAQSFGIPVFHTTAEAQRGLWPRDPKGVRRKDRRKRSTAAQLRALALDLRRPAPTWVSVPGVRITFFALGVVAFVCVAALFIPRATIQIEPMSQEQSTELMIQVDPSGHSGMVTGSIRPEEATITLTGKRSVAVQSQASIPTIKARGVVEFRNLTATVLVVPAGTVVYSVAPDTIRFVTLEEGQLGAGANSTADIAIEALEPGEAANLPAGTIQGIEGHLSASAAVSNEESTSGGGVERKNLASQADRDDLRAQLLQELEEQALVELQAELAEDDVIVPGTLGITSVVSEIFDPAVGQPGSMLSLSMTVSFRATYARGADLGRLAQLALDTITPPGYSGDNETLELNVVSMSPAGSDSPAQMQLRAVRTIRRIVDEQAANLLVRGKTVKKAGTELQTALPLAAPPSIRLDPSWWPWLPLIPFRINIVQA